MKIVSFVPYALQSREAGLVAMIANYLRTYDLPVTQIRCNGIVPTCDRDSSEAWQRSVTTCLSCISEQTKLGRWAEQRADDLSPYISPADIDETKRWMLGLSKIELLTAEYEGISLARICKSSFEKRFETDRPDVMNRSVEMVVRRMILATARIMRAMRKYAVSNRPDFALIASGEDYLTAAAAIALRERKVKVSVFGWNKHSNDIAIENPVTGKVATYPLVFENVTQLRQDIRTWPSELSRMLEEILAFIDLAPAQVALPLAR